MQNLQESVDVAIPQKDQHHRIQAIESRGHREAKVVSRQQQMETD